MPRLATEAKNKIPNSQVNNMLISPRLHIEFNAIAASVANRKTILPNRYKSCGVGVNYIVD